MLKSRNLAYEIAEILSERIIHMELKPGERILEAKIAKEFNVSQSSVREALRVMEQSGLVEINQRRGTYVTQLTAKDIEILYDLITDLYAMLITRAMEHKTTASAGRIFVVMKKIEAAADNDDVDGYFTSIFELAVVAMETVGSPLLKKVIMDSWPNKRRVEYLTLKLRKHELKNNLKYFKALEKYMIEPNLEKMVKTIREYTQHEKKIAISNLEKIIHTN
ncbi:MAG TPA: GntR family transcriptional regulator [Spirochaetota bacterium]|nr:GntR family transcriptional regulator [Spirochaetota bacterium]